MHFLERSYFIYRKEKIKKKSALIINERDLTSKTCSRKRVFQRWWWNTCNSFVSPAERHARLKRKACVWKTRRTFDFRYFLHFDEHPIHPPCADSALCTTQYLRSIRIPRASLETYYLFQWFHDSIGILRTINSQSITTRARTHARTHNPS